MMPTWIPLGPQAKNRPDRPRHGGMVNEIDFELSDRKIARRAEKVSTTGSRPHPVDHGERFGARDRPEPYGPC